ncbi:hypothetical protein [Streptomyces sp. MMS24-I29]|uniref:hypothetical protein n=1 Tax=Streptomyces sp. MMS24-I29 TaxID=3351480 RepID=UPI003C7E947C
MSVYMLTASIAVPADRTAPIDFDHGRQLVGEVTDKTAFDLDDPEWQIDDVLGADFDPEQHLGPNGQPSLGILRLYGRRLIDDLKEALGPDDDEVNEIIVAGFRLYISGGISPGDPPTEATRAIRNAYRLPHSVLQAMGFIPDYSKPLSRANGSTGAVTDTDIVDAIALGLGTNPNWSGATELNRIADLIGTVRKHPGDVDPVEYYEHYTVESGFDPLDDSFLASHIGTGIDDGANEDSDDDEDEV